MSSRARAGARELPVGEFIGGAYANNLAAGRDSDEDRRALCASRTQRAAYMKFQVHERPTLGLGLWLETPDDGPYFHARARGRGLRVSVSDAARLMRKSC